ncbi:MAG TPA: hypothetical protein VEM34_07685 [Burkholderiales bacterium]|nr:hypothetical protein [Burkholderiales bacterium]
MKARAASLAAILAFAGANAASAADQLYTAYNIWFEQPAKVYSTNYQKGNILPAGSEVKDVVRSSKKLEFTDPKLEMKFSVEFVGKHHPGLTGEQWADRFLTRRDFAALSGGLSAAEIKAIRAGQVQAGMSKKAVLLSAGYPPEVATASTKLDTWKYWRDRFRNYLVQFSNGKVTKSEQ